MRAFLKATAEVFANFIGELCASTALDSTPTLIKNGGVLALAVVGCACLVRPRPLWLYPRSAFLRGMGVVYCCAFLSLYIQYAGLFGSDGLMPAETFLERARASVFTSATGAQLFKQVLPTVAWWRTEFTSLDVDAFHEGLCLAGALLAVLPALGITATAPVFALLWFTYLSLYAVGQTFLSFHVYVFPQILILAWHIIPCTL